MHMTKTKPTQPGWYWFLRSGSQARMPIPARVILRGRTLVFTTGQGDSWDRTWAGWDPLSTTSPNHRWSSEPIPEPTR